MKEMLFQKLWREKNKERERECQYLPVSITDVAATAAVVSLDDAGDAVVELIDVWPSGLCDCSGKLMGVGGVNDGDDICDDDDDDDDDDNEDDNDDDDDGAAAATADADADAIDDDEDDDANDNDDDILFVWAAAAAIDAAAAAFDVSIVVVATDARDAVERVTVSKFEDCPSAVDNSPNPLSISWTILKLGYE